MHRGVIGWMLLETGIPSVVLKGGNTNNAGSREGGAVLRKRRSSGLTLSFIRLPITYVDLPNNLNEITLTC